MALNRSVMYAVSVVLPTLALMAVVARFSVRRMKRAALGADDWTCLAGLVSNSATFECFNTKSTSHR